MINIENAKYGMNQVMPGQIWTMELWTHNYAFAVLTKTRPYLVMSVNATGAVVLPMTTHCATRSNYRIDVGVIPGMSTEENSYVLADLPISINVIKAKNLAYRCTMSPAAFKRIYAQFICAMMTPYFENDDMQRIFDMTADIINNKEYINMPYAPYRSYFPYDDDTNINCESNESIAIPEAVQSDVSENSINGPINESTKETPKEIPTKRIHSSRYIRTNYPHTSQTDIDTMSKPIWIVRNCIITGEGAGINTVSVNDIIQFAKRLTGIDFEPALIRKIMPCACFAKDIRITDDTMHGMLKCNVSQKDKKKYVSDMYNLTNMVGIEAAATIWGYKLNGTASDAFHKIIRGAAESNAKT